MKLTRSAEEFEANNPVRDETVALLQEFVAADRAHFEAWATIEDEMKPPADVLEAEPELLDSLHKVALAARAYARTDLELFERERLVLGQMYAIEDHSTQQLLPGISAPKERSELTDDWAYRSQWFIGITSAAAVAAGWPHRMEPVTATVSRSVGGGSDGGPPRLVTETIQALYERDGDIYRSSHTVIKLPRSTRKRDRVYDERTVRWIPCESNWGKAEPEGSIAMRLTEDPNTALPVPYPRFPKPQEVGLPDLGAPLGKVDSAALQAGQGHLF